MPRLATIDENSDTVYVAECEPRNPFEVSRLPLAARLYRYRKGVTPGADLWQTIFRRTTPSRPFLKCLFAWAGPKTSGEFVYRRGTERRPVQFRVTNTQFRALYFPEYADGYEPDTSCLIDLILAAEPRATVYDIGANWGFFSLRAASRDGFRGRIHAFEPQPATFADLTSVVEQAGLSELVTCHAAALSDRNASGFIQMPDGLSSGLAALTTSASGVPTRLVTLDSLTCEPPDLLKVDVEGAEAAVFTGGRRVLSQYQPMIVFESWLNESDVEETLLPLRILQELGYRLFEPTLASGAPHRLTLAEFVPERRRERARHFNVFACHQARCDRWLRENFTLLPKNIQNVAAPPSLARRAA